MIHDTLTVMWKDLRELLFQRGTRRGTLFSVFIFLLMLGIFLPLQMGRDWLDSSISLFYWGWFPFTIVNSVVADAFAGERERHTLETLLASRLSDLSILLGKIFAAVSYGWGLSLSGLLLGLITVNIKFWNGHLGLFPLLLGLGAVLLSLLMSTLAAGIGVLVSLRSSTVRQAQQTVGIASLVIFLPLIALTALPAQTTAKLIGFFSSIDFTLLGFIGLAVLFIIDVILIGAGVARFKRTRLILD